MEQTIELHIPQDMAVVLKIQSTAIKALTDFLDEKEFLQMMPVMLSTVTDPLCHSVYDARIKYLGQDLQLTKSMILHKQLALTSDKISKIYIMSPNVRLEKAECGSSGRHLIEFSQLDIEIKFVDLVNKNDAPMIEKIFGEMIGKLFGMPVYIRVKLPK